MAEPGTDLEAALAAPSILIERPSSPRLLSWLRLGGLLRGLVKLAIVALALTLVRAAVADQYLVPTGSMWPTIQPGDRIFVAKTAYGVRVPFSDSYLVEGAGPRVGDMIVFSDPRGGEIPLVKRVVALAGQSVALKRGVLHVDGVPQRLERLPDGELVEHLGETVHVTGRPDYEDYGPVVVPEGSVFVMGDNRTISLDSRFIGPIPKHLIRGQVLSTVLHYEGGVGGASNLLRSIR